MKLKTLLLLTALISGGVGYILPRPTKQVSENQTYSERTKQNQIKDSYNCNDASSNDENIKIDNKQIIVGDNVSGIKIIESELEKYGYKLSSLDAVQWNNFVSDISIDYWSEELNAEQTLLNLSIAENKTAIIRKLLNRSINIDSAPKFPTDITSFRMAAGYSNLEVFKMIVDNVKDLNSPIYKNIINYIKNKNEITLAESKIEYLFDSGYAFDNLNLQILPLFGLSEELDNPVLVNKLATINPNTPIYGGRNVMLSKIIAGGANDDTVMQMLPYFDASKVPKVAASSLILSSIYSKRIQDSSTVTALINTGLDVNARNFTSSSILMNSIGSIRLAKNDEEFEIQKEKIQALINAGADVSYVDSKGRSALTLLDKSNAKEIYKERMRAILK